MRARAESLVARRALLAEAFQAAGREIQRMRSGTGRDAKAAAVVALAALAEEAEAAVGGPCTLEVSAEDWRVTATSADGRRVAENSLDGRLRRAASAAEPAVARILFGRRAGMSDYDYLNARVRGMSTELLAGEFYEQVLGLVDGHHPHRRPAGHRLCAVRPRGAGDMTRRPASRAPSRPHCGRTRSPCSRGSWQRAPPEPRRLLALQLNRWDVVNVVTLLRCRWAGAGPHEALAAVVPLRRDGNGASSVSLPRKMT